jgi:NAD(P)-dependent dehydrogenase (short-subunit alcohol dehydrogenase family)
MATSDLAIVLGASGGIGRALAEQLSARQHVVALSRRRPEGWPDAAGRIWLPADILDEASLAEAATRIAGMGEASRIVVATGRLGLRPEKSTQALTLDALAEAFAINAAGPALVAKHLLRLTPRDRPSVFAALSARVGSIGDNRLGGWHAYRASKAALNMLVHTIAIEHRRTRKLGICVTLHPGTVDTGLSKPFQAGVADGRLFTPARSATALLSVIDGLGPDDNGGFYAWDGTAIPW